MQPVLLGLGESISSRDVAVIDANSEALGVPRLLLMENAGRSVASVVEERTRPGSRVVIYAGPGGNGGDGLAAARHLAGRGYRVSVVLLTKPEYIRSEEARHMYRALEVMDTSADITVTRDPCRIEPLDADVVIDALLGVGLRGAPRSPYREAIRAVNESSGLKVSVDVPSGLNADTGETPGDVVRADITVTLHKPKPGLYRRPDIVGELIVAPIGAPPEAETYVGPGDVAYRIPRRRWDTRKGHGGRVLVIGGSRDYIGAPLLAALAAEAAGIDLVFVAGPAHVPETASRQRPTLIPVELGGDYLSPEHLQRLRQVMSRVDAVAIGMGLGLSEETRSAVIGIVDEARRQGIPIVVDADGLKHLAGSLDHLKGVKAVLTPHDAEYARLFGEKPAPITCIPQRILDAAKASLQAGGATLLLKGPIDVIAEPTRARLNKTGAPSMSAGGTGDVLAGLTAALLAKGLEPFHAAGAAAYINGAAGALAYREKGDSANALDIISLIPKVVADPLASARDALLYRRLPLRSSCRL